MARILVIDDEPQLRALLETALGRDGHSVRTAGSAAQAERDGLDWADVILLDVMMPGEDGFAFARRVRERVSCPIVFLTARDAPRDVLYGLAQGGDDYLAKPFDLDVLRARIGAHLRREARRAAPRQVLRLGDLALDIGARALRTDAGAVPLTRGEYAICETLARHRGMTFTREQLLTAAFGYESESDAQAVTEHIRNIRAKLRAAGQPSPIETVWGIGYRWKRDGE